MKVEERTSTKRRGLASQQLIIMVWAEEMEYGYSVVSTTSISLLTARVERE